jgi:hypothetical protein
VFIRTETKDELQKRQQVREAIIARQGAEINLNEAVEHDLVDAAIYELHAADLRLNHLLKECRTGINA